MSYREQQRTKAVKTRDSVFKDSGQGVFKGKARDFVLREPESNLWEGIRQDVKEYFKTNKIPFWPGNFNEPSGHLLSSQVACLNHLFFMRQRKDVATEVLKALDKNILCARTVDTGYVEFEFIGEKNYLKEKSWTPGANCTSIDAVMIGQRFDNTKVMFFIEWKYTEKYPVENKYIKERYQIYDKLIQAEDSPFKQVEAEGLYYEPFYQMMRQTLLAGLMTKNRDHKCSDYRHVHVIPTENKDLLETVTSPKLKGKNITEAWRAILRTPDRYITVSPEEFMEPVNKCRDCKSVLSYLKKRY
ncbi:MAG: hypothetical protein WC955_09455 [Elusimicrobiota bacterium]